MYQEYLTFYLHNTPPSDIKKKGFPNMSQQLELCLCFSMNMQLVKRLQNRKRLRKRVDVVLLFPGRARDNISTVQRTKAKRVGMNFLCCFVTLWRVPTGHSNYLKEIIICCIPTPCLGKAMSVVWVSGIRKYKKQFSED